MKNIFSLAEGVLYAPAVEHKVALTHEAWFAFESGQVKFDSDRPLNRPGLGGGSNS